MDENKLARNRKSPSEGEHVELSSGKYLPILVFVMPTRVWRKRSERSRLVTLRGTAESHRGLPSDPLVNGYGIVGSAKVILPYSVLLLLRSYTEELPTLKINL